jgi:hypothetical protein
MIPTLFNVDAEMNDDDDDVDPADAIYALPPNNDRQDSHRFVSGLPYFHPLLAGFWKAFTSQKRLCLQPLPTWPK